MRVKITDIPEGSRLYEKRNEIIGKEFEAEQILDSIIPGHNEVLIPEKISGVRGGWITTCQYIEVPEPSAMSELAGWLNENVKENPVWDCRCYAKPKDVDLSNFQITIMGQHPAKDGKFHIRLKRKVDAQKKSWLQKIRGYDDLQERCNSVEYMRDHYKEVFTEAMNSLARQASIITEKSRELKLMEVVADKWQQRLICVQKDYSDSTEMIGKRLKFSVGHNHVTITIGNPITLCKNFVSTTGTLEWSISECSRKDAYNWKDGVIKSLDNLCKEHKKYTAKTRRDLHKALAKKYPEVYQP